MHVWQTVQQYLPVIHRIVATGQVEVQQPIADSLVAPVVLSRVWQILGPWSIGTREAPWGADPLEYEGGFPGLKYSPDATYPGSLVPGGSVPWTVFNADFGTYFANSTGTGATLKLSFGEVDWEWHQKVYGWAGMQWQAWARGSIEVSHEFDEAITLYSDSILEYYVDGKPYYGGDFYSFRTAPSVVHLSPGRHQFDIRVVRDVRAMGGLGSPTAEVTVELRRSDEPLTVSDAGVLVPDVLDGRFASRYCSVTLRNNGRKVVHITSIRSADNGIVISRFGMDRVRLAPGQTKPVTFMAELREWDATALNMVVEYTIGEETAFLFTKEISRNLTQAYVEEPYRYTFLHPSGMASYAMLKTPASKASCPTGSKEAPILIALHGAGVEASWPMSTHSFDAVPDLCAWLLIPTGTTRWSADDWHTWGQADVEAAVEAIPTWIKENAWEGIGVDTSRWFVVGHSNGGQGTWHTLTHHPDKVLAAVVASGYSSIQNYVPYHMWSYAEPQQAAVIQASLNDYRHELFTRNVKGVPLVIQHGGDDDNVPAYHGRLMGERMYEDDVPAVYSELPGAGHWFDGVMTTDVLRRFYHTHLNKSAADSKRLVDSTFIVANPASTGTKAGMKVLQLLDPGRYGKIDLKVTIEDRTCNFRTSNVYSFWLEPLYDKCELFVVDGEKFAPGASVFEKHDVWWGYHRGDEVVKADATRRQRSGRQLGGIDAVLRTNGAFKIIHDTSAAFDVALQISRNFAQYYSADSVIYDMSEGLEIWKGRGNVVSLLVGRKTGPPFNTAYPLRFDESGDLEIRDISGSWRVYQEANAAIFVQPLSDERIELVVWGKDQKGLELAARLVPTLTGVGQPDFVLLGEECRWKGIGGVVAMGFFDHEWNVTGSSWFS